ncbi:MAG: hypothetical protein ACKOWF_09625 [Chloroflexota bacterium]
MTASETTSRTIEALQTTAISRRSLARYILPAAAIAAPVAAALLPGGGEARQRGRRARNPRLQAGAANTSGIYLSGRGFAAGERVDLELRFDFNAYYGTYGDIASSVAVADERGAFLIEFPTHCPYDLDVTATQRRGVIVNQYFVNFPCLVIS